jgi:hypothetical protein
VSRSIGIGDRGTVTTLASRSEGTLIQPLARINAPTPKNVAVFALSLLLWPTAVAIAVALLTRSVDPRVWLVLAAAWSMVEFWLRNPHQVTLERQASESAGSDGYDLRVRSWGSILLRSPGETIALGPDSRLVRNVGVIDCSTGRLLVLRIYRRQFAEMVRAFEQAGFELHDECRAETRRASKAGRWNLAALLGVAIGGLVLVGAAALFVASHG